MSSSADRPLDPSTAEAAETPAPLDWEDLLARVLRAQNDADSHVERDPRVWHPSQLARCKRQAVLSSYGLEDHDTETLGIFRAGTLIHEWLEESFDDRIPGVEVEHEIDQTYEDVDGDSITIVGQADVWDRHAGVVYDWKSRGGWYNFDPPKDRHLDQLTLYMDALDAEAGQIVYINKKKLDIRPWPETTTFTFDPRRRDALLQKAADLRDTLQSEGIPTCKAEVPFEQCGCYPCSQE